MSAASATVRSAALVGSGVLALRAIARLRAAPSRPSAGALGDPGTPGTPGIPGTPGTPGIPGAGGDPAPVWEPAALTALAAWEPAPPRTAVQRAAGLVWAAPLSAAGLVAGLCSLRRPVVREGVLLFRHARGLTAAALRRRGFAAAALGHVVVALGDPTPALLAHELVHVRQAERLGVLMAPAYLGMMLPYGYRRHPLERAARRAGARVQATGGDHTG